MGIQAAVHIPWFDEASYKGYDLLPIWDEYVKKHYEEDFEENHNNWANSSFHCAHRVKFDLYRRFGYIAAAGYLLLVEKAFHNDPVVKGSGCSSKDISALVRTMIHNTKEYLPKEWSIV